ncbi:RagB/SusD family nutrient uptake outer membrane protein, partial [bacterium]|nr:RagB/SusD family nutrient uptake outer membrane protein [bacterium]
AGDPRFEHTIVDGNILKAQGASYTEGYQNTDYFIKKYAPIEANRASDGDVALGWGTNQREIRLADVYLMAAEAIVRGGGSSITAREYINRVRNRVGLGDINTSVSGSILLDVIYKERRLELATEGHRFFDLVRTGQAPQVLNGFNAGIHELLPIPQIEIDLTNGQIIQNPGY